MRMQLSILVCGVVSCSVALAQETPAAEPAQAKPATAKPAEAKPAQPKAVEAKPAEVKTTEAKPAEAKPAEAKPAEAKPAEAKPAEAKPAEAKPAEAKPAEAKPAEAKPAEAKPADAKPADAKPADAKPTDSKPAQAKTEPEEPKKGWHDDTPALVANRASLGLSLGLGAGSGGDAGYKSDLVSYSVIGDYVLNRHPAFEPFGLMAGVRYHTTTGVHRSGDVGRGVQNFIGAGGLQYRAHAKSQWQHFAFVGAGLQRAGAVHQHQMNRMKVSHSPVLSLDLRSHFQVFEKIETFGGVFVAFGKYRWTELQMGVRGTF